MSSTVGENSDVYTPSVKVKYRYEFVVVAFAFTDGPNDNPSGDSTLSTDCRYPVLAIVLLTIWNRVVIADATFWQDPLDTVLRTLESDVGVNTAFLTISKSVVIVVLASSHDPTDRVLATLAREDGVLIAAVTRSVNVVRDDLTSLQDALERVRVIPYRRFDDCTVLVRI